MPKIPTDEERLNYIQDMVKRSRTGISFDYIPAVEDERSGYRFMRFHHIGEPCDDIREAIDRQINAQDR